jgi:hypothetical protein
MRPPEAVEVPLELADADVRRCEEQVFLRLERLTLQAEMVALQQLCDRLFVRGQRPEW